MQTAFLITITASTEQSETQVAPCSKQPSLVPALP